MLGVEEESIKTWKGINFFAFLVFSAVLSNDAFLALSVAHVPHSSAASQGSENKHPLQQTLCVGLATLFVQRTKFCQELVIRETEVCSMPQYAQISWASGKCWILICTSALYQAWSVCNALPPWWHVTDSLLPLTLQLPPSVLPIPQRISSHLTHCSPSR